MRALSAGADLSRSCRLSWMRPPARSCSVFHSHVTAPRLSHQMITGELQGTAARAMTMARSSLSSKDVQRRGGTRPFSWS